MSFDRTRSDGRYKYATVAEAQDARRRQNRERERLRRRALGIPERRPVRQSVPVHQVIPTIPPPPKGVLAVTMAHLPLR